MIIIIHGNGLTAISKKISEIKSKFDPLSILEFSGKQIEFDQALVQFATGGLFSQQRLVTLEDFDPVVIDLEKIPNDSDITVIFKFTKNLPANSALLKKAAQGSQQIINLTEAEEANIFPFLDKLAEKNLKVAEEVDKWLSESGSQYLLTMIFYMLRRMIQPPQKLPGFIQQKIAKQKQNFPADKIAQLYKEGLETDFKIKSGLVDEKMGITLLINKILTI